MEKHWLGRRTDAPPLKTQRRFRKGCANWAIASAPRRGAKRAHAWRRLPDRPRPSDADLTLRKAKAPRTGFATLRRALRGAQLLTSVGM